MNPLVSVVIPAFNHEKYIEAGIRSILDQTYDNLELIVVDDGSQDKTFEIIQSLGRECAHRLARHHFETGPNRGVSANVGRGFALAQGDYVYVLDSDDLAKPVAISRLSEFLITHPDYALAVGNAEIIDSETKLAALGLNGTLDYEGPYNTQADYLRAISHGAFDRPNFGGYAALLLGNHVPNGFLIRKSAYEKVGGHRPDLPIEDWYIILQLSKYYKMKFIDKVLASYRRHPTNTMLRSDWMLAGLAATFAAETQIVAASPDGTIRQIYEKVISARTKAEASLQFGRIFEYGEERFGFGAYYAARTKYLKLFGRTFRFNRRTFLAGRDIVPGPGGA